MKKALVTILKYVIFLGLGIGISFYMIYQLKEDQRRQLVDSLKGINYFYLIPIFIVGFFSHFFRSQRWRLLLETIDLRPTATNTMFAVMIGYITNLVIPRAGEVAKCTVLAKYEKLPAHKMIGTIVAERAFDILCLLLAAVLAFLFEMRRINDYVSEKLGDIGSKIERHRVMLILILGGVVLLNVVLMILYRRNKETKVGRFVKELNHGILSIFHMKKKWQFLIYTFLMWFMYLMQVYIGLRCLHDTAHLTLSIALVVLVYGSVGLILTPGGIGLYPLLVAQILVVYFIADVPAIAFGWLAWGVQEGVIIVLGLISLIFIHSYNTRRTNGQAAVDTK